MNLSILVAVAENGVIGREGQLPWHLSSDLRRFKRLTMGHAILMGRKTWESIGRPLPGRTSIVLSRQANYQPGHDGVLVATNLDEALAQASRSVVEADEAFIIGGAGIYEMCLPRADRLLVTRVHAQIEGDVHFPQVDWNAWQLIEETDHGADDNNDYPHTYQLWQRK
jgi:dihydrofolate reductase